MDNRYTFVQIFYLVVYVLLQVVFLRNVVLFDKAFCFAYIAFLLLIPLEAGTLVIMLIGFVTGLIMDVFYDSLGIHAASCVLIMFLRPYVINLLTPIGGYDGGVIPSLKMMGVEWFSPYAFILIFIHHIALFFIEVGGFSMFFFTLSKAFFSAILTFTVILIIQYMFYSDRRTI